MRCPAHKRVDVHCDSVRAQHALRLRAASALCADTPVVHRRICDWIESVYCPDTVDTMDRKRTRPSLRSLQKQIRKEKLVTKLKNLIQTVTGSTPADGIKFLMLASPETLKSLASAADGQLKAIISELNMDSEPDDEESESSSEDEVQISPPSQVARPSKKRAHQLQFEEFAERMMGLMNARLGAHTAPAPTQTFTHTREIVKWQSAHTTRVLPLQLDAWLAGALCAAPSSDFTRTTTKNSLEVLADTLKDVITASPLAPWSVVEPIVLRALATEAASEIFLRGNLRADFIPAAVKVLVHEGPSLWSGSPTTILKKVEEQVHHTHLMYQSQGPQRQGGRHPSRQGRRSGGGNDHSGNRRRPQAGPQPKQAQQQQPPQPSRPG